MLLKTFIIIDILHQLELNKKYMVELSDNWKYNKISRKWQEHLCQIVRRERKEIH